MLKDYRHAIQYGALGTFMSFVLGACGYLLHVFVPIWVNSAAEESKFRVQQTVALQSIAASMEDFRIELHDSQENLASQVSLAIQKRKR